MKKILFTAALACAVVFTSCGDKSGLRMGSLSEFDSLSYALGANIGYGMNYEMGDIPFDTKEIDKGIKAGALEPDSLAHVKALDALRDYFMTKRGERAQAIAAKNAADSTKTPVKADPSMFESEKERAEISYAFGNDLGFNIKESGVPAQIAWIIEAMQNVRDGKAQMTEEQVNSYIQYYFMVKRPAENAAASKEYLSQIEKESGVKKTESGLLYKVTREGDAKVIAKDARDTVVVNYKGTTRKGETFDSSYDRKEPATFPLNRVIPGWTEGLQLVGKGGAITLWIPSELAYGERGAGRDIGANEALCFEVEVLDVKPYVEPVLPDSMKLATPVAVTPAK
ncbi:MAG: FKBP-type peptidyl-prolyl cis-trans isomerase [Alistipes sp.]